MQLIVAVVEAGSELASLACAVLTTGGLVLSYGPDLPAGAVTIILTGAAYFLTALIRRR